MTNNIDALRDIYIDGENFCVDATSKSELEGYTRGWPMQTDCEREVVAELIRRGVVKDEPELFINLRCFGCCVVVNLKIRQAYGLPIL